MKNWKKGREEQRKFYGVKLGSKQSIISTLASLFLSFLVFLPLAMVLYQFVFIYGYERQLVYVFIVLVWISLQGFNALMNYWAVRFAKVLDKNNEALQSIEEKHVIIYQFLNPGFAFASLAFILFIAYQLGAFS
ncbi:MAG: hypothetical protein WBK54_01005 [Bacilli bacterium]|jgi:hypothetical protein|nr:hypothetical protein [Acholeplasmataceae bacterium]